MYLFVLLIALGVAVTHGNPKTAKGLNFIGVGYNLLKGNPDGGDLSNGGIDPGLLFTRKIFKLTWNKKKLSSDRKFRVPDQVVFAHRSSCVKITKQDIFSGAKSYQDELKVNVKTAGGISKLWKFAFSLSTGYERVNKKTSKYETVFYEKKEVCNQGRARYQLGLAYQNSVTDEFTKAVCRLPQRYIEGTYLSFVENWGTHIVEEVELGTRKTKRYESRYVDFFKYAMKNMGSAVSVSGSYLGYSASLSVDMNYFRAKMTTRTSFGKYSVTLKSGGPDMLEPIGLKLVSIDHVIDDSFFRAQCKNLAQRKGNIIRLLGKYPSLKGATTPQDPKVHIPLTWPLGTYGLPMTKSGCPGGSFWHKGRRYHDTEDNNASNDWSVPYDLAGRVARNNMEQKFCMKTKRRTSDYNLPWPEGKYCIFKKGNCPAGFKYAYVLWDDEDKNNENSYGGQIPDGRYDRNTNIEYCCRTDGYATNAITLPNDKPFVLIKSNSHLCQKVRGLVETEEYFYWDTEDNRSISDVGGPVGAEKTGNRNIKVHYCYYQTRFSWWLSKLFYG